MVHQPHLPSLRLPPLATNYKTSCLDWWQPLDIHYLESVAKYMIICRRTKHTLPATPLMETSFTHHLILKLGFQISASKFILKLCFKTSLLNFALAFVLKVSYACLWKHWGFCPTNGPVIPSYHIRTDNWSTSPISCIEDWRSSRPIRHRRPRMAMATPLLLCSSILKFSCSSNIKFLHER